MTRNKKCLTFSKRRGLHEETFQDIAHSRVYSPAMCKSAVSNSAVYNICGEVRI